MTNIHTIRSLIQIHFFFLLQINELYEEVLHEILHCIGAEKSCLNQENIIAFAQKAFKIEPETHEAIYQAVVKKEVSVFTICLKIVINCRSRMVFILFNNSIDPK